MIHTPCILNQIIMHYTLQFGMEVVLGVTACINRPCHAKKISILKLSTNKHTYKNLTCESRSVRESWSAQVTFPLLLGLTVCVCVCLSMINTSGDAVAFDLAGRGWGSAYSAQT